MPEAFDPYHKWLGIPPKDQPPNHYRLLGVDLFESDPEVIAIATDQRMVHVRSFQLGKDSDISQRLLNEIAAARVCLLNPEKRAAYDGQLREQMATLIAAPQQLCDDVPAFQPLQARRRTSRAKYAWFALGGVAVLALILIAVVTLNSGSGDKETAVRPATAKSVASKPPAPVVVKPDPKKVEPIEKAKPVEAPTPPSPAIKQTLPTGWVRIVNRKTGFVLWYGKPRQIEPAGDYYKLRGRTGQYLALADWAIKGEEVGPRGGRRLLCVAPDTDDRSILWKIEPLGNGFWSITNCVTGKCLEACEPRSGPAQQSEFRAGDAAQEWRFEPVKSGEAQVGEVESDETEPAEVHPPGGQPVVVVAVWEHHWKPLHKAWQSEKLQLFSDGNTSSPGGATWDKKNSTLTLRYRNSTADICTLSEDGRSYEGRNTGRGNRVWGRLLSEQPMPE